MKNASVCNAKFNVGDYVEVVLPTSPLKGRVGRICAIDTSNKAWPYEVYFSDRGSSGKYGEKEIAKAYNSAACNAKFKVGDKVKTDWKNIDHPNDVGIIEKVGIFALTGENDYIVKFSNGKSDRMNENQLTLANSRAINSTNPVVRKALNAVVCNSLADKANRMCKALLSDSFHLLQLADKSPASRDRNEVRSAVESFSRNLKGLKDVAKIADNGRFVETFNNALPKMELIAKDFGNVFNGINFVISSLEEMCQSSMRITNSCSPIAAKAMKQSH